MDTNKKLLFQDNARQEILKGVQIVSEAVGCTLGPRGKCVVIENPGSVPVLTKDGISVAKSINLKDQFKNLGVQMVKGSASRTVDVSGDGTSTCTILVHSIYDFGLRLVAAKQPPSELRKGIEWAVKKVVSNLEHQALKIEKREQIVHVGTVSSNGDTMVGELIAEAMDKVGKDGVITIEPAKGYQTTLSVVDGMQLDRGYCSSYFTTNNEKMTAELADPIVLITNQKINTMDQILSFLEQVHRADRPLLIIADEIGPEALQGLTVNKLNNVLQVCAIMAPGFGESREEYLSDVATLTGGKVVAPNTGLKIDDIDLNDPSQGIVGHCKKVVVSKHKTMIVGDKSDEVKNSVEKRIGELRERLKDPGLEEHDQKLLQDRLGRLSGGVAILRVGGSTELEMKEKYDRVEDSLCAVQAAMKGGIVPGGGVALVRASLNLGELPENSSSHFKSGVDIVKKACEAPFRRIVENSDKSPELILEKVKNLDESMGYDAEKEQYVNMIENGIIDPALVPKVALENAASTAALMLTIDAAVCEEDLQSLLLPSEAMSGYQG